VSKTDQSGGIQRQRYNPVKKFGSSEEIVGGIGFG
jgi:hypothetical protein